MRVRTWMLGAVAIAWSLSGCGLFSFDNPSSAPGAGGDAGTGNDAGASAGLAGGAGGASTLGGSGGSGAVAGFAGAPSTNGGSGGASGVGGAGATGGDAVAVHGTITNFWGYPLSAVTVHIGGKTDVTDDDGGFTITQVTPPYDVWFLATTPNPADTKEAWLYQGLTRSDPTFRVYRGGNETSGKVGLSTLGVVPDPDLGDPTVLFTVGTPVGVGAYRGASGGVNLDASLNGPTDAYGTAHALSLFFDSDGHPSKYLGYGEMPTHVITLDQTSLSEDLTLDLTPPTIPIATGSVTGTINALEVDGRNWAWLIFNSNGIIPLIDEPRSNNDFVYLVPSSLPGGTITVAAKDASPSGAQAFAHRDGLSPSSSPVVIDMPTPTTLHAPGADAVVDPDTDFQWQNTAGVSVLQLSKSSAQVFVVTNAQHAQVPIELLDAARFSSADPAGDVWGVETHGSFANVDEATGPPGLLDELSEEGFGSLVNMPGPVHKDGSFTTSALRTFSTPNIAPQP